MKRLAIALLGVCLGVSAASAQSDAVPVPKQAKVIELDGNRYAVPDQARGMRVETRFLKPNDAAPKGRKARGLPPRATSFRGAKVPEGADRYYYVLKFVLPKKRGAADVLDGTTEQGTYEVEAVVVPPKPATPPEGAPLPPPSNVEPLPPADDPPASAPPAAQPPRAGTPTNRPRSEPTPPTPRSVVIQIDY